ncbi:MAG: hypothetical protein WBB28_01780 [Crinalium sp.]
MAGVETLEEKIVAVLHDAVEDSNPTTKDLLSREFPAEIVDAIAALTKQKREDYEAYLERVIANPLALRVKIADMRDNMDIRRIKNPTNRDYARLTRYQRFFPGWFPLPYTPFNKSDILF